MKIKEIRKITDEEKVAITSGCDTSGDGLDKPPC